MIAITIELYLQVLVGTKEIIHKWQKIIIFFFLYSQIMEKKKKRNFENIKNVLQY